MDGEHVGQNRGGSEGGRDADRARKVRRTCLFFALMVAGVFGGWLAGEAVRAHLTASHERSRGAVISPRPTTLPGRPGGEGPIGSPLAEVGLVPVDADPAGLPPPARARRLFAFRRELSDAREELARYEVYGTSDEAADHYVRTLTRRDFALLQDGVDGADRRVLVFDKPPQHVTVALRQSRGQAGSVIIVVTAVTIRPLPERAVR